ncbi:MAG: hypothetical protein P0S95_04325 [Rhabdochlamydiaceae bacterium]|nr:hypothetical protein [Candidatus Amphrikana amoebophyrae]
MQRFVRSVNWVSWKLIIGLVLLSACSVSNLQVYQKEGSKEAKALIKLLELVNCKEDMAELAPKIKKRVEKLTHLMIEAKKYKLSHRESEEKLLISVEISNELKQQMLRIYQINGVEKMMHDLQRYSLHKLDEFDRLIEKKAISSSVTR